MSTISKNKYRSSDDLTPTMPTSELTQNFAFTSNNVSYTGMRVTTDTLYYVSGSTETEVYNTSTKWVGNTEYIAITLSSEQSVTESFKTFFDTLYQTIDNYGYSLKVKLGDIIYVLDEDN